jgi:hypothetical protein
VITEAMVKRFFGWWAAFALALMLPGAVLGAEDPPTIAPFRTAQVTIEGTVSAQGQVLPIQGVGEIDAANGASHLTVAVLGAAFESIVVDGKSYTRNPLTGRWEYSEGAQAGGFNPARLAPYDPATIRAAGRNFTRVGPETINGIPTTHWRADTDLNLLLGLGSPSASGAGLGQINATMDLWIGDVDQRLHRLAVEALGSASASAVPGTPTTTAPARQALTLTFKSFDTEVRIIAPPGAVPATPGAIGGAGIIASPVIAAPAATRAIAPSAPAAAPSAALQTGSSPSSIMIVRILGVVSLTTVGIAALIALQHRRSQAKRNADADGE